MKGDGFGRRLFGRRTEGTTSNTITGGVFLNAVVQGHAVTVTLPPQVTPAGLPRATTSFTGRETEVELLLKELAPGAGSGAGPVSAVAGLAGVGKTELVVQAATRAQRRPGWFPGGVLFVDMFGYDPQRRLSPGAALLGLLQVLGLPGEYIPAGEQDRAALFRSVLAAYAAQDRRLLLVIDNAATVAQVTPLLPSDDSTATLITSRHTLAVGARLHDLDVLDVETSVRLLADQLQQLRGPADTRGHDEPQAAAEIAELCAGLPLALHIAAGLLADTGTRTLASLAEALRAAHTRLDRLSREDRAVRAAFDLSYRQLSPVQARLFRLLSVNPGPDAGTDAAACLVDTDAHRAETLLADLARAHLVEPGPGWGRWRMHDLVRLYAEEQSDATTEADARDAARARLFTYYVAATAAASAHLQPPSVAAALTGRSVPAEELARIETTYGAAGQMQPPPVVATFSTREQALAWLETERPNLVAVCTTAGVHGHRTASIGLASLLHIFLSFRRHLSELITVTDSFRAICRQAGDRHGEGMALSNLGVALNEAGRSDEAVTAHTQAVELIGETGDRHDVGMALNNLGLALRAVGRFDEAITAHTRALDIYREIDARHSEGLALNNLGQVLRALGRFDEAITAHTRAAEICRETGDRQGDGLALDNLGADLQEVRQHEQAVAVHARAADIFRELDDRRHEAEARHHLGSALREVGRFDEAAAAHTRAVELFGDGGDRSDEGMALTGLGLALRRNGRYAEAAVAHTRAAEVYREIGDRRNEGIALSNLGVALQEAERFDEATEAYEQAMQAYREAGDRQGEGVAANNLGNNLRAAQRSADAAVAHRRAADIFRAVGDRYREGKALIGLCLALLDTGQDHEVRRHYERAVGAFAGVDEHESAALVQRWLVSLHPGAIPPGIFPPEFHQAAFVVLLGLALAEARSGRPSSWGGRRVLRDRSDGSSTP
ncbi:tetratricopeptide repeat protein [Micromonospora wenchangensis]|uniref:tetratricopeptide repeat protein n=1 Tax=Micromonospora wenchangensis TaxID=1185415 RepID=UPI0013045A02|nr:tetratricopeptide repeat protein [Micromonospora wenchangensis]